MYGNLFINSMSMNLTKTFFHRGLLTLLALGAISTLGFGQNALKEMRAQKAGHVSPENRAEHAEFLPATEATDDGDLSNNGQISVDAQWDQQFNFDISTELGYFANAGAFWTGTEFWVSKWNSDTIASLDINGNQTSIFTIPGISGVRSITTDGTDLFLGGAADTVYRVNPATKTLISKIPISGAAANIGARFLTYDPTLDGGNGGFYIGNFTSPIGVISKTGATLNTIATATHGRVGMYGAAYDPISTGGPYLWVFEQSGSPSDGVISQLQLPAGTWTGVSFDVASDLGLPNAGAGGLFIASGIVPGQNTIGGVLQGDPNTLFGLELDFSPVQTDAQLVEGGFSPALSIMPFPQSPSVSFTGTVGNFGQQNLTNVSVDAEIIDLEDFSVAYSGSAAIGAVPSLTDANFNIGPFVPADTGGYFGSLNTVLTGQTDENPSNDSAFFGFFVSDSAMARDQGGAIGSFGVGGTGSNKVLAQKYTVTGTQADYLTSVTMALSAPTAGDIIFASVYTVDPGSGGPSNTPIANTTTYTITPNDATNGIVLTLPLAGNPQPLPPGQDFFVGINELGSSVSVLVTSDIYEPGNLWFRTSTVASGAWVEAINEVVLVLRPNFGVCTPTPVTATLVIEDDDSGNGDATLSVTPSGGSGTYTYLWNDPNNSTDSLITGVTGGRTYSVTVTDSEGCEKTFTSDVVNIWATSLELPQGVNTFKTFPNPAVDAFQAEIDLDRAQDVTMTLIDPNGRMIFAKELRNITYTVESVNVSDYAAGVYTLQITTDAGTAVRRVTIK